ADAACCVCKRTRTTSQEGGAHMKSIGNRLTLGAAALGSLLALTPARAAGHDTDIHLRVRLTSLNDSGITGTASVSIDAEGLVGRVRADQLVAGHAYTVWLFYQNGDDVGGPGRFDSAVAEDDDATFRGRVRGLQVMSGATVRLVMFDHPDLGATDVSRAD